MPEQMSEPKFSFRVHHIDGAARAGELTTLHGRVSTPLFMPVATQATVKTMTPQEVAATGAGMVLCNAYHLYLRPGIDTVKRLGGLHKFMGWSSPILTDSGGFQVFSMGHLRKVDESGVRFRSHLDGTEHWFPPDIATTNQEQLGADIIMCMDQCIAHGAAKEEVQRAMERTHRWAQVCQQGHARSASSLDQALFGIVQGGAFLDLRQESASYIAGLGFDGYAIGGLAVGESKAQMYEITQQVANQLPEDRPRYLMGVGSPEDLVHAVACGIDMFDCALPTRVARHGGMFTRQGRVDITNKQFMDRNEGLEEDCDCYCCRNFSVAYLWHLFRAKEILGPRLASIHNLSFISKLMREMRHAVTEGTFDRFQRDFLGTYQPTNEEARQQQKQLWLKGWRS
jgi:queuine tRNA-ribosyltransferase